MKNFCLYFSLFFLSILSCIAGEVLLLQTPSGKVLKLELAVTAEQRELGLMFRKSMAENEGMLFIFPEEKIFSFWMKNTSIPLSIAFLDSQGKVINIEHMVPFSLESIVPQKKAKYAIEVNRGKFPSFGIYPGTQLDVPH